MRGYEGNDYEDWDEYEDDEADEVEEEGDDDGYEEDHQPTQEALEYLSIRQKLKESIRKQMKKDAGTTSSSSRDRTSASRKDNYGSFFGPSQPVIAQRVIQESRSLLENPDLAARIYKTNKTSQQQKKSSVSAPASSKPQPNYRPTVTNGLKKKVEMLKNTRDYSFLLSDDVEVPTSSKGPPPRNVSAPKSDARSTELTPRSRPVVNGRGREDSNYRDGRRPMLPSTQKPKVGLDKLAHTGKSSAEARRQLGSSNGSGPGRPLGPKAVPARSSVPATAKATQPVAKNIISGARKPTLSTQPVARRPTQSNMPSASNRPSSSHSQPSVMRRPVHQQQTSKPKFISKQALPSSKAQLRRSPPRHPPRAILRDERPKPKPKRPLRDEDSENPGAISSLIRNMFRYDPRRYQDDGDDSDMEANFEDIMREEKRSAKIARQEDEEQLRLIEEEEKRERMRLAKRRKMGH